MKDREKECVSAYLDAADYWRFRFKAEENGQNIAQRLRQLVLDDICEEWVRVATEQVAKGEQQDGITPKQKGYLLSLAEEQGKRIDRDVNELTKMEANYMIQALLKEKREGYQETMWGELDAEEEEQCV